MRSGRFVAAILSGTVLLLTASVFVATSAGADSTQHVYNTGGEGLYLHPDAPGLNSSYTTLMPDGTEFDVSCWQYSDNVSGDSVWDYGTDASTGETGYAADYYIDTNVTQGNEASQLTAMGIQQCGSSSVPSSDLTLDPSQILNSYDRNAAVQWALAHAQDPQVDGAECTFFVSEALWAGGFPQQNDWESSDPYHFTQGTYGSTNAWNVQGLLDYLQAKYPNMVSIEDITSNLTTNAVPDAQPGDIIGYDWDGDGNIDHLAFVTSIDAGDYPEVAEMGQVGANYFDHRTSPYVTRGWTYSELHHIWLQSEPGQANMGAYLIHISGDGELIPSS